MERYTVTVEQEFTVSAQRLWNAITRPSEMQQWFFSEIPAVSPEVGFQTEFTVKNAGRIFPHLWKILEVKPEQKLTYDWRYRGYDGRAKVTFLLTARGKKTILKLKHKVVEPFPSEIPEFTRESCQAGWEYFVQDQLKDYLTSS